MQLVLGALGKAGDVGPGIAAHKLLQGRQSAEEVEDQGYEEAKALEAQHDQPQRQPVHHKTNIMLKIDNNNNVYRCSS